MTLFSFSGWIGAGAFFALWYAAHQRAGALLRDLAAANATNQTAIDALTLANTTNGCLARHTENLRHLNNGLALQASLLAAGRARLVRA